MLDTILKEIGTTAAAVRRDIRTVLKVLKLADQILEATGEGLDWRNQPDGPRAIQREVSLEHLTGRYFARDTPPEDWLMSLEDMLTDEWYRCLGRVEKLLGALAESDNLPIDMRMDFEYAIKEWDCDAMQSCIAHLSVDYNNLADAPLESATNQKENYVVPLHENAFLLLEILAEKPLRSWAMADLIAASQDADGWRSKATIYKCISELAAHKFVKRPRDKDNNKKKQRWEISEDGLSRLNS